MHSESKTPGAMLRIVVAGVEPLSIEDVVALAHAEARLQLPSSPEWRRRITSGAAAVERRLARGDVIYGVNTGYGDSCDRAVAPELVRELPRNLVRYHGCGLGRQLDESASAAVLVARIASLARGYSGVRLELLEGLCALLERRVLPVIPEEGSVGASGDLTPLSYVAAVLIGEREVLHRGRRAAALDALRLEGLEPIELAPKEALAVMNGTAMMTALACLAFDRARRLGELACRITALDVLALRGNRDHFHPRLFELKPHPGQAFAAAAIRAASERAEVEGGEASRIQDPYSLRCAPHVIGVLADGLAWMRTWIETELNGVNDNPVIDPELDLVLHGGHFYGGHVAFAMDALKTAVANVADLLDRQLALLVDHGKSRGLPANLSGAQAPRASVHHGFKAVQIATSAWTAEALKLTMPASAFSRSTECHNQDKVSLGTIAARDALRVLELTEQVAAAGLLAGVQAVHLRMQNGELTRESLSAPTRELLDAVLSWFEPVTEDRALDGALRQALEWQRRRTMSAAAAGRAPLECSRV